MEQNYRCLYRRGPNTEQNGNFLCRISQSHSKIPFANIRTMYKVLSQMWEGGIPFLLLRDPAFFYRKVMDRMKTVVQHHVMFID